LIIIGGNEKEREKALPALDQLKAAVIAPATMRLSTITVVNSEYFRLLSIIFSPSLTPTKSEIVHFYTVKRKNLLCFRLITIFRLPLFIKISQNSTLNLFAYRPLTPPDVLCRFPGVPQLIKVVRRVNKGKRLPVEVSGV